MAVPENGGVDLRAIARRLWPRHTVKMAARALGVPIGTAHEYVYRKLARVREPAFAEALLAEAVARRAEADRIIADLKSMLRGKG